MGAELIFGRGIAIDHRFIDHIPSEFDESAV
jgi:hypothetical protein